MEKTAVLAANTAHEFFISTLFHKTWELFKKQWLMVYVLTLLPIAAAFGFGLIFPEAQSPETAEAFPLLAFLLYLVLQMFISMIVVKGQLLLAADKTVTVVELVHVAPRFLHFVAAQLLMMLIVCAGILLFIVPGIRWSLMYFFAPYLVLDKNMGPIEALKASAQMTDGIKWDMLGFMAASTALAYLGLLAFVVGIVVSAPVAMLSYVVLYRLVLKRMAKKTD